MLGATRPVQLPAVCLVTTVLVLVVASSTSIVSASESATATANANAIDTIGEDVYTSAVKVNVSLLVLADLHSELTAERYLRPAVDMAVEKKNATYPNLGFNITFQTVPCDSITAPYREVHMFYREALHGVIGPACPFALAPTARFARYLNLPIISSGIAGEFDELRNTTYQLLTRVWNPNVLELSRFFYKMLNVSGWRKFSIYYDRDGPTGQYRQLCYQIMNVINADRKRYTDLYGERETSTPMSFSTSINFNHSNYFQRIVRSNYSSTFTCSAPFPSVSPTISIESLLHPIRSDPIWKLTD